MNILLLFFLCANLLLLCALGASLPKGKRVMPMMGLSLFLPGLSLVLYAQLGQPWLSDHPLDRGSSLSNAQQLDAAALAAQETFAALSSEERSARILGMVANLSERLYRDGGTAQEWLRLARAHSMLRAKNKARAALVRAEESHPVLREEKGWLAASLAVLLVSPLDAQDKKYIRRQLAEAKALFGSEDSDLKTLEAKLLPLLQ